MSDEMTTLGIRVALKLGNCAHLSVAWHVARFLAASFLFTGVSFVWPALRSRIQVQRPQPFPQLRWPFARLAFALHFHVPRECLRCERHERRCPGRLNRPGN